MIITGSNGQLAKAFSEILGTSVYCIGRQELDLHRWREIPGRLDELRSRDQGTGLRVLVNTAAYTEVDLAETERDEAETLNTKAPGELARWAAANGYLLVHYSSDFVYSGAGTDAWREQDAGSPLNHYGATKLAGEALVRNAAPAHLILRTSWLYGEGKNFPRAMLGLARQRRKLQVVSDQIGAPTHTDELVRCTLTAIRLASEDPSRYGTYNLANAGATSKFTFAKHVVKAGYENGLVPEMPEIEPVSSDYFRTPAARPKNSRLSLDRFRAAFGETPEPWEKSFEDWLGKELVTFGKTRQ